MKTMNLFVSLDNFNNQAEYDTYRVLPIEDTAKDDSCMSDVLVLAVGYSKIVIMALTDDKKGARKTVLDRKVKTGPDYWSARSVAVNGKALTMHGPDFKPFTVVPVDTEDGFEIIYRMEDTKND